MAIIDPWRSGFRIILNKSGKIWWQAVERSPWHLQTRRGVTSVTCAQCEPAFIREEYRAPMANLPILFSDKCKSGCMVLGCEHRPRLWTSGPHTTLMESVSDSLSRNVSGLLEVILLGSGHPGWAALPEANSVGCRHRLMLPLVVWAFCKMQKWPQISQKRWGQGNYLWPPPAEPFLYRGCFANCLSFPPVVCPICTTAG